MSKKNSTKTKSIVKVHSVSLENMIEEETRKRKLLTQYINEHLKEGIDYGTITIESKKTGRKYESKPTLFKAGSEKFASLMHLRPTFKRDNEAWEMAGKKPGLFCYVCYLLDNKGNIVGEGRGSCDISEKRSLNDRTVNEAIKLAEKRAQIDAILRTGGLSDFFTTQSLEEQSETQKTQVKPEKASQKQLALIMILLDKKGYTKEDVYIKYQIHSLSELNKQTASTIIENLQKLADKKPLTTPMDEKEEANPEAAKKEERKKPALNFQIAWVKTSLKELKKLGLVTQEDEKTLDFLTEERFKEIQKAYKSKKGIV